MWIVLSTAQFKYLYRTTSTMSKVNVKWTANLLHLNTPFTQKIWLTLEEILLLNFELMEVPVEVHKIINFLYIILFFYFRWRCWWSCHSNKLSRMPIRCAFHSVSNIHRHFRNHDWVCPICPELFPICIHTHLTHNC